jgi:hypothetical protein
MRAAPAQTDRHRALRPRIIDPAAGAAGPSEVASAASVIARVWEQTRDNRYLDLATGEEHPTPSALQIVFCDLSTPATTGTSTASCVTTCTPAASRSARSASSTSPTAAAEGCCGRRSGLR